MSRDIVFSEESRLTFLGRKRHVGKRLFYLCSCICGVKKWVRSDSVSSGSVLSCGCLLVERRLASATIHGMSFHPMYNSWHGMLQRCTNPNSREYKNYGGRGIKVCKRWLKFENFLVDMGRRPTGFTIERKNNDGNYIKGNCTWALAKEQSRNKRDVRIVSFNGQSMCVAAWAEKLGIPHATLYGRLFRRNWPVGRALGGGTNV